MPLANKNSIGFPSSQQPLPQTSIENFSLASDNSNSERDMNRSSMKLNKSLQKVEEEPVVRDSLYLDPKIRKTEEPDRSYQKASYSNVTGRDGLNSRENFEEDITHQNTLDQPHYLKETRTNLCKNLNLNAEKMYALKTQLKLKNKM